MVIDDGSDEEAAAGADVVAGDAYRESLTSVDGFTRGPNGKVKFNKDTKKRRREADEAEDVEMADADAGQKAGKKSKKRTDPKFGHEFKAKVSYAPLPSLWICRSLSAQYRKQEGTSKRTAWIRTRTCRFRRLRRNKIGAPGSVSPASGECCSHIPSLYAMFSHRFRIHILGYRVRLRRSGRSVNHVLCYRGLVG